MADLMVNVALQRSQGTGLVLWASIVYSGVSSDVCCSIFQSVAMLSDTACQ